jgi:hypothetical protein
LTTCVSGTTISRPAASYAHPDCTITALSSARMTPMPATTPFAPVRRLCRRRLSLKYCCSASKSRAVSSLPA